jgi:hypothetical protein
MADEVMDAADGCPMCSFAALRQAGRLHDKRGVVLFDLTKELQDFWKDVNERDERNSYY